MYFKAEILFFSICHAVEWSLGPVLFLTPEMQTLCAKFVTCISFSYVHLPRILYTFTFFVLCQNVTCSSSIVVHEHVCVAEASLPCGLRTDRSSFLCCLLMHLSVPPVGLKQATEPARPRLQPACPRWLSTLPVL